jgi:hypothetical protein
MNLDGFTSIQKFEVPLHGENITLFKNKKKKGLEFEFKLKPR